MTITVNAPNGAVVNFPDGTATDTIKSVMAKNFGGPSSASGGKSRSWDEDVLPSLNAGLNRGADALLGLPGDVWHGARYLANRALGYKDPITDILPTSESLRARREANVGPGYQPETTAGRYAQTIGEFLPGAALAPEENLAKGLVKFGVVLALHQRPLDRRRRERRSSLMRGRRLRLPAGSRLPRAKSRQTRRQGLRRAVHRRGRRPKCRRARTAGTPSRIPVRRRSTSRRPRRRNSLARAWAKSFPDRGRQPAN